MIHFTNINGERLPEDVNKIANERWDREYMPDTDNKMALASGFVFSHTEEKHDKWWECFEGNYEPLRKFHNL